MTKISFNRTSDWVKSQKSRELRYVFRDERKKPPVDVREKKRHNSPDPDGDRVTLRATQSRLTRKSKNKPSMPRMPWGDKT